MSDFWKCIACGLSNNKLRNSCQACFTKSPITSETKQSSIIIKHSAIQPKIANTGRTVPKNELLTHGFIRQHIQNRFKRHTIFALSLIQMICDFYSSTLNLFLYIAYTETKYHSISNLVNKYCRKNISLNTSCYVPNISSHINMINSNKHKSYDGFIGICKLHNNFVTDYNTYYTYIALVKSNKIPNKMIYYDLYLSSKSTDQLSYSSAQNMVYCKQKRMIIYYHRARNNASIKCLKLNKIDLCSKKFQFKVWRVAPRWGKFFKAMECIYDQNKLFLMTAKSKGGRAANSNAINCNLFDYNTKKWKSCSNFQELKYKNSDFSASICKNNKYNPRNVYVVSNNGQISIYDMNKNKWNILYPLMDKIVMNFDDSSTVWFDDNPQ
eukprot:537065_1